MSVAQTGKPVKIAWLTPVILHEAASFMKMQQAEGGTWLDTLFDKLREDFGDNAEFIVIHPMQSVREVWRFERGNVEYVLMPRRKYGYKDNFGKEVAQIADILNEVQPDLLHIHGTEEFYGLVSDRVSCNSVISLQGFRDDIWRCYFTDISMNEYIWLNLKARKTAFIREISYYKRMVQIEKQVLAQNRYYIGRTQYDRMHSTGRNPRATYFGDCHDILREAFYKERWKLEETLPFSIHTTMTERPYKGILLLIQAVDILRRRYPQVKMFVA
ncbi:MAG: hypothetical protein EAZ89_03375, partial [Bacteroidetes bacterium]